MTYKDFNDFLEHKHMKENPTILDDELPDAYEEWLSDLSPEEWIELGDEYMYKVLHEIYGIVN